MAGVLGQAASAVQEILDTAAPIGSLEPSAVPGFESHQD